MFQMKKQDKNPEEQLSEVELGNLAEKQFRVVIVKMIQDLGKKMETQTKKIQEIFNKELEDIKNKQTEINNTITEMKNILEGINSRINEAEEQTSELEDNRGNHCCRQIKEKRMKRNEDSLRDLWDNIK